jgi:hypothetical protein
MSERAQRVSHANGAGPGAPASERVGGSGGAKPPGLKEDAQNALKLDLLPALLDQLVHIHQIASRSAVTG